MIIKTASRLAETKEYFFSIKLREVRALASLGHDVINLGIGNPDLPPSQVTIERLVAAARQPDLHGYQPYKGLQELREAIADWYYSTYQVSLNAETEILPLIGSKEGITHISLAFLDPGDEVLVPELGYPAYKAVSTMVGAKTREYPLLEDSWMPDWSSMEGQDYSKVKIMWLNYPHMPTGTPAHKTIFENAVAFAKKHQILLCHDNPYSLVLNQKPPVSLLSVPGAKEVALELNSMSKSHNMAGWRIGWISGQADYLDAVLKIKSNVDSGSFAPLQLAAVEALRLPEQWHRDRNQYYQERLSLAQQLLDKLNCWYADGQEGMFLWAKIPGHLDAVETLVDYLLKEKHIFITPGFVFGSKGKRYIRLSLCAPPARYELALERLADFSYDKIKETIQ